MGSLSLDSMRVVSGWESRGRRVYDCCERGAVSRLTAKQAL